MMTTLEVDGRTFSVHETGVGHQAVIVAWHGEGYHRGTAEAEQLPTLPDDWWWVNRVLVQPDDCRSNGIGSEMLRLLSRAAYALGCRHLVVTPGGYVHNARDKRRQVAFYERNGFTWQRNAPFSHDGFSLVMVKDLEEGSEP
jgi:GNAT superfamily N-acetyltransferase